MTRHDSLLKTAHQGTPEGAGRRLWPEEELAYELKGVDGRPVQDLLTIAQDRREWRDVICLVHPQDLYHVRVSIHAIFKG